MKNSMTLMMMMLSLFAMSGVGAGAPPEAPENVNTFAEATFTTVTWEAADTGAKATKFFIYKTDMTMTTSVIEVAHKADSYVDYDIIPGAFYVYQVTAANNHGESEAGGMLLQGPYPYCPAYSLWDHYPFVEPKPRCFSPLPIGGILDLLDGQS